MNTEQSSGRTIPKQVNPLKREQPLLKEIERLRALVSDLVIYDRASNHPVAREVWSEARGIHDQVNS